MASSSACFALSVRWIQSSGMELRPNLAPRQAPIKLTLEQLQPPAAIASLHHSHIVPGTNQRPYGRLDGAQGCLEEGEMITKASRIHGV